MEEKSSLTKGSCIVWGPKKSSIDGKKRLEISEKRGSPAQKDKGFRREPVREIGRSYNEGWEIQEERTRNF